MSVRLNSSIGGSVTLTPTNSANNTVATLPARNGTVILDNGAGKIQYSDLPSGTVLQVVNTTLYTPTSVAIPVGPAINTDIPQFFCSITPRSASSKILVQVRWFGEMNPQSTNWDTMFGLKRNGTAVGVNPNTAGAASGISMAGITYYSNDAASTPEVMYFDYYDSPNSTSQLTYQVYANNDPTGVTIFTNRTVVAAGSQYEYGSSTMTLWEIAG